MNNNIEKDKLKVIFGNMKKESPSMSFETNLMQRIHIEHKLMERKRNRLSILSMALGTLGLLFMTYIVLSLFELSIFDFFSSVDSTMFSSLTSLKVDGFIISVSIICLILLIGDTLVRKYIGKKEES